MIFNSGFQQYPFPGCLLGDDDEVVIFYNIYIYKKIPFYRQGRDCWTEMSLLQARKQLLSRWLLTAQIQSVPVETGWVHYFYIWSLVFQIQAKTLCLIFAGSYLSNSREFSDKPECYWLMRNTTLNLMG